jgi:DNA-binding NtrC family response regulator
MSMSNRIRILSISDDDGLRFSRELVLRNKGYETESITSNEGLSAARARSFDIALICRSVHPTRAMALSDWLRQYNPEIQIVCIAPIEDPAEPCEADLEILAGPEPLLETIRALCAQVGSQKMV